jgi:hypothetical protein
MIAHIGTDSDFIAALLQRILTEEERADIEIENAGISMYSVARTLLASRGKPVAVVIDANTPNPEGVEQVWQSGPKSCGGGSTAR